MNTVGLRIASLRKAKDMTQEEFAAIIGVTAQSVSKWETGVTMPDILLLPVIAGTFGVSTDYLFGKEIKQTVVNCDETFDTACEGLRRTIVATSNSACKTKELFSEQLKKYEETMKTDKNKRSVIIRNHGVVYYRNDVGGLLLKKPKDGWHSLLQDKSAADTLALLSDARFARILNTVIITGVNSFTVPYICTLAGIENVDGLETLLEKSSVFRCNTVSIDGKTVSIYELTQAHRLFALFAALTYAKEFAEYDDDCYIYFGDNDFLAL